MTPVELHIAESSRAHRDQFVEWFTYLIGLDPVHKGRRPVSPETSAQMVDGFIALLTEALEGSGTEVYTFYVETMVPGSIAAGASGAYVVKIATQCAVFVTADLIGCSSHELRGEVTRWLASFYGRYIPDVARAAASVQVAG